MPFRARYGPYEVTVDSLQELKALEKAGAESGFRHGGRRSEPGSKQRRAQETGTKWTWLVARALFYSLVRGDVDVIPRNINTNSLRKEMTVEKKRLKKTYKDSQQKVSEDQIEQEAYSNLFRKCSKKQPVLSNLCYLKGTQMPFHMNLNGEEKTFRTLKQMEKAIEEQRVKPPGEGGEGTTKRHIDAKKIVDASWKAGSPLQYEAVVKLLADMKLEVEYEWRKKGVRKPNEGEAKRIYSDKVAAEALKRCLAKFKKR